MKILPPANQHPAYDPLLTIHEGASYLGLHTETLKRMARTHEISCVRNSLKKGSNIKFRLSALNAWAESHEVKPVTSEAASRTPEKVEIEIQADMETVNVSPGRMLNVESEIQANVRLARDCLKVALDLSRDQSVPNSWFAEIYQSWASADITFQNLFGEDEE